MRISMRRSGAKCGVSTPCGFSHSPPASYILGAALRVVRALTRRSGALCQVSMSCGLATRPTNFCPKRCGLTVEKPVWSTCQNTQIEWYQGHSEYPYDIIAGVTHSCM